MCDSVYKLRSYNTAELIMLNYRVSVAVCAVVLLVLLSAVRCAERRVTWSVEGVSDYQGTTFDVELGDTIIFECVEDSYSNVIYQPTEEQLEICNSSIRSDIGFPVGECYNDTTLPVTQVVTQSSAILDSVVPYTIGETVYFTSYSNGLTVASATMDHTEGGECLLGLKLAVKVISNEVKPTSTEVHDIEPTSTTTSPSASTSTPISKPTTTKPTDPPKPTNKPTISPPEGISGATSLRGLMTFVITTAVLLHVAL